MARYKAYYNKSDIVNWKPGQRPDDYESTPFDEDDDLHILQSRIQERASKTDNRLLYIQRVKIVDTSFEEKFNKKQEELRAQNTELVEQSLMIVLEQFKDKTVTPELLSQMKKVIAEALARNPMIGVPVSEGEILIKHLMGAMYELNLPTYNLNPIRFSL